VRTDAINTNAELDNRAEELAHTVEKLAKTRIELEESKIALEMGNLSVDSSSGFDLSIVASIRSSLVAANDTVDSLREELKRIKNENKELRASKVAATVEGASLRERLRRCDKDLAASQGVIADLHKDLEKLSQIATTDHGIVTLEKSGLAIMPT
jgi:chromosome segregation ATPase